MNDNARNSMHQCKESLETAKTNLENAASQVENGTVRDLISNQLQHVSGCLEECQKICSGLSQQKNKNQFKGIYH